MNPHAATQTVIDGVADRDTDPAKRGDIRPRISVRGVLRAPAVMNHDTWGNAWVEVMVQQRIYRNPTAVAIWAKYVVSGSSAFARIEAARALQARLYAGREVTLVGHGMDKHIVRGEAVLRLMQLEALSFATTDVNTSAPHRPADDEARLAEEWPESDRAALIARREAGEGGA